MNLITNGIIITENSILEGFDLLIKDSYIHKIIKSGQIEINEDVEIIDASGGYVVPGFIDIHSDFIEHMAAPRPSCLMDIDLSLRETERELVSHGITTMFHSLSIYGIDHFTHNPIRKSENIRKIISVIENSHKKKHLIRHRFHARFEVDSIGEVENLKEYISYKKLHMISFMDHTPGQGQYRNISLYKDTLKGYGNLSDEQVDKEILKHQSKEKITIECMQEIAELARENNIPIASHDDDTYEKLDFIKSIGTNISEFPTSIDIAKRANELGMFTIAGAPNVLLGGSHNGNLSAHEAIKENCIDILCSDYYPPGMIHAVFKMHEIYGISLVEMIKKVSLNPARAVKMDDEIGSIKEGKKADLLIIEKLEDEFPIITKTFVDGTLIHTTNYRV
ncbi:phosphonate metabolism protein PhnM [Herbivorax sp. ANBcel31]|uniref:phosphonate metabolism protein PhnM n=1 Tax=Herbivorax sp. ANBcel31 TaxID=3069754 RepID=UPI0027B5D4E8|nr:phosphonate metabolism protein PhnM [Herbivorax sp. ANBcel31]MDQ2086746.1 phosphonate metabolism protein PhnM [Herbivorax sp. ANBcel31]